MVKLLKNGSSTTNTASNQHVGAHPAIPRFVRLFSIPILLFWLALVVVLNTTIPQLEAVGQAHSVSLAPDDAPSLQALKRVGENFKEFDSNSSAMILLEGDSPLGSEAHHYYDGLIAALRADHQHVQNVQDFWSDPLTASGSQSADGKAAYVQLYLAGNQGERLANESVQAVRDIVAANPPPQGLHVYVTGPAAMVSDQHLAGDKGVEKITAVTLVVIFVMLLLVYGSIVTVLLVLLMVFIQLAAARGIVAFLGFHNVIGLSTFAVNLLTTMAIAAASAHDAVITTGGVSMGDVDLVKVVLGEVADMTWMQVAIRPAKPFAFGVLDGTPVFGLPGNPVSSLVSLAMLALPGLRAMAGRGDLDLPRVRVRVAEGLDTRTDGRTAFVRARVGWVDGRFEAVPVSRQGSHQLAASADANALLVVDGAVQPGETADAVLLRDPFGP